VWRIYFKALVEGEGNAAIADQVAGSIISLVKDILKGSEKSTDISVKELAALVVSQFNPKAVKEDADSDFRKASKQYLGNQNFLIYALTLNSSQKVRTEAKEIISQLSIQNKDLQNEILR
jgi:hypothetical protein